MSEIDILQWNATHNEPSELMQAITELSHSQVQGLALSLAWDLISKKQKLQVKRAVLRAVLRTPYDLKKEGIDERNQSSRTQ